MQGKDYRPPAVSETQAQQSFIDERDEISPHAAGGRPDPSSKRQKTTAGSRDIPVEQRSPGDEKDEEEDVTSDEESQEESRTPVAAVAPVHGIDPEELRALPEPMREIEDQYPWLREKRKELRATPETGASSSQGTEESHDLVSALKKARVTGKGVELIENITSHLTLEDNDDFKRTGFLQVRIAEPKKLSTYRKPVRKKDGDKNLKFSDCPPEVQKALRGSRVTEWQKWKKFNAGVVLSAEELKTLQDEGVPVYPMQWVETDKNAHNRRSKGRQGYQ